MFGWIPLIGPLIDGIVSIWKGYQTVAMVKYTTDGKVDTAAMEASASIIESTKNDIGIRILRDMALTPPVMWSMLIGWDTIIAKRFPGMMFHVADYPPSVQYIPYMAFVFLFGAVGLTMWKRR